MPTSELVISTYNNERSLHLCLASLLRQDQEPDSVCIADDGSRDATRQVVDAFRSKVRYPVRHVWHEDHGFRKCEILNKAIASSESELLIFIDGDVLMHPVFIARHLELARRGRFVSGSMIKLSVGATAAITEAAVMDGSVFLRSELRRLEVIDRLTTWLKTMPFPYPVMRILDLLSPIRCSFGGANASVFREDILSVNGFDERMRYGGLDKELGQRLKNAGLQARTLRYSAPLLHLEHSRGYIDRDAQNANRAIRRQTKEQRRIWAEYGILKSKGDFLARRGQGL